MFVRIKETPNSPRKSVQIVKSVRKGGKISQKIVRYIGIAMDDYELAKLKLLAESVKIKMEAEEQGLLFSPEELASINKKAAKTPTEESDEDYKVNLKNLVEEERTISGIHDVYGSLFEEMGYGRIIKNPARNKSCMEIIKHMVMARIANPESKRASVETLEEDFGISLSLDKVYNTMDKIEAEEIERINEITYQNTLNLFGGKLDLLLYDCTTLYFESFTEDELKKNGYSKDCKFNQPQVLLALMVTKEGLPVGYQLFPGNTYEGHTLIPILKDLRRKYNLDKIIFVADSGLLNKDNIAELETLENEGFEYIVGSRLKSLPKQLQQQILNPDNYDVSNGSRIGNFEYNGKKLIITYSAKRAKKDSHDRLKAIEKLSKKIESSSDPKAYMANYGYKKYLKFSESCSIELNKEKIDEDSLWDGLHGVLTNAKNLSHIEIIEQYKQLWQIENAFRITKHDLKVRPVFHWKPCRVKAHIAISFIAYSLVKYLEYRVRLQYIYLSPESIRQALIRVQTSILYDNKKKIRYGFPSKISEHARKIYKLCNVQRKLLPFIIAKNV